MIHSNVDTLKLTEFPRMKYIVAILSLCVAIGLLTWSLYQYQPNPNFYGPRAIYSMLILSIALALLGRVILLRMLKLEIATTDVLHYQLRSTWRLLFLFDITAPLYLAAGVLIGPPAAVLLALITQTVLQGFTLSRRSAISRTLASCSGWGAVSLYIAFRFNFSGSSTSLQPFFR